MIEKLLYQIRIKVSEKYSKTIRNKKYLKNKGDFLDILNKYGAVPICQFDAFSNYVEEAEEKGVDKYPLYKWTKATIENVNKKEKYLQSFTIYVDGEQIYSKKIANNLETDLKQIIDEENILEIFKYDTNPNNSPQIPKKYR